MPFRFYFLSCSFKTKFFFGSACPSLNFFANFKYFSSKVWNVNIFNIFLYKVIFHYIIYLKLNVQLLGFVAIKNSFFISFLVGIPIVWAHSRSKKRFVPILVIEETDKQTNFSVLHIQVKTVKLSYLYLIWSFTSSMCFHSKDCRNSCVQKSITIFQNLL